jgi:WD40 repeat protein
VNCVTACYVSTPTPSEKCLLLISGSVDATIDVWRAETGEKLHTLKGHSRGILDLAIDPLSTLNDPVLPYPETVYVLSASSTPEIRSWRVSLESAKEISTTLSVAEPDDCAEKSSEQVLHAGESAPYTLHDTSVNKIIFSPSSLSASPGDYDLYTASSDNTSKVLARPQFHSSTRHAGSTTPQTVTKPPQWTCSSTFTHPDWVRAIAHDPATGFLVTACRDEEVRVWDTNEGECVKVLTGHFDSVEGVALVELVSEDGEQETWILSVSLDGTLRRWKLKGSVEEAGAAEHGVEEVPRQSAEEGKAKVVATEDEDRELAELMAELEDDD